jgi:hypothetical protein
MSCRSVKTLLAIPAPETALRLLLSRALSSVQSTSRLSGEAPLKYASPHLIDAHGFLSPRCAACSQALRTNGSGVRSRPLNVPQTPLQVNVKVSVRLMTNLHLLARVTAPARERRQLDLDSRGCIDDMIVADAALVSQAENVVKIEPPIQLAIS